MNSRRAEKTTAAERAENMIEKIKYWLFQKGKDCKRCCLRCRYYDICRWDVLGNVGLQSEETITLLAIENSKPHKDGLLFRICQYVEFKQRARREHDDQETERVVRVSAAAGLLYSRLLRLAASSAADRAVFITFRRAYKRAGNSNHALEATQEREAKNENNKHFELKGRRSQDLYSGKHGV